MAQPLIDKRENVGVVVSVLEESGRTSNYAYGFSDKEKQQLMTEDKIFGIGSVTKPLVVALLLALDNQGILSVNDPIGPFLPKDLVLTDPRVRDITLGQLASHTSGLPREPVQPQSLGALLNYVFTGDNLYARLTPQVLFDYMGEVELMDAPGQSARYSNIGVGLLAHFIVVKTGRDLDSLLKQYIFEPLGMNNTRLTYIAGDEQYTTGYSGDQPYFIARNTPQPNWTFSSVMIGTGGGYSTGPDLIKFIRANLGQSGTYLDEVLKKSRIPLGTSGDELLTMGWYLKELPEYHTRIYYYHGMVGGFNCYIGFEPDAGVGVAVMRNNFNWTDTVGQNLVVRLATETFARRNGTEFERNLAQRLGRHSDSVARPLSSASLP